MRNYGSRSAAMSERKIIGDAVKNLRAMLIFLLAVAVIGALFALVLGRSGFNALGISPG